MIFGGGQLGDSGPLMEAMQAGNLQFAVITSGDASQFVNAHENAIITTRDYKINEVQKYVSETGHVFAFATLMASNDWFKKLPKADQDVIQKAAVDSALKLGLEQKANEAKAKAELISKGMGVNVVDMAPFVKAVEPVIAKYAKGDVKKFYDAIMAIK